jgi:hypothetical protein
VLRSLDDRLHQLKIPDPNFEWIAPAVVLGSRILAARRFDLIVSSAAPFSSHVVAHRLHAWSQVPWVGDFSDPYAENPFVERPEWRRRIDRALEDSWFRSLDGVIVPVPEMREFFLRRHPKTSADSIHVIPYGFDDELIAATEPRHFEGFTVVHTGTFYHGLRDPGPFFRGLSLVRDLPLRVVHAGVLHEDWVRALEQLGISDRFEVLGLLPREGVVPLQLGGSCLLSIGNRGGLQLPGKLLDYLGAGRPILALRNDTHDIAADLVESTRSGLVVPNEPASIAEAIRSMYAWWKEGALDARFTHDGARDYAWSNLESRLDGALRGLLKDGVEARSVES